MLDTQISQYLESTIAKINKNGINLNNWEIDHICYRTSSLCHYEETKEKFSKLGECLIESEVNGRPIATYKLKKPIQYNRWIIDLIEVPAPKPGQKTLEGLEHIEIVIDQGFEELINLYPHINFDTKAIYKKLNPELKIQLDQSTSVKFHHKSLEHVINIEKSPNILRFLEKLDDLKKFGPCISGTIPLDIHHGDSDLDILFCAQDLDAFENYAKKYFSKYARFQINRSENQGLETSIVNFEFDNLPIELFCQNKSVYQQRANQHFLIEGRLLKVLGQEFKRQVRKLKDSGIKTEPAFGQLLNLEEPYRELVELNKLSDKELLERFSYAGN